MVAIRGIDYLKEVRSTTIDNYPGPKEDFNEKRILCVKFRHQPQQADSSNWFRRGSRDASAGDESRQGRTADHGNLDDEADDSWTGDTAVFFLLMQDDAGTLIRAVPRPFPVAHRIQAFDNVSRVIHRDSYPCPSSFFPYVWIRHHSPHRRRRSYSPLSFKVDSPVSSPEPRTPSPPTPTSSSVRYPEWRIDTVRKAWRAGLGDVGRAMELARFGNDGDPDDASDYEDNLPDEQQQRGRTLNEKWGVPFDDDSDGNGTDDESEREWEGWEADHTSGRARRPLAYDLDGMHPAPTADYSFPPRDGPGSRKSLTVVRRSLHRYSSVDSLKQSVQHMTPVRSYGPIQVVGRAESPSPGVGRSRPRSPLASGEFDNSEVLDMIGMEPGLAVTTPQQFTPDLAYPTRRPSHESGLRSTSGPTNSARGHVVPYSMAMSTITSTVTAGDPAQQSKKSKSKGKAKASADTPQKMARKRSLTVQGTLPTIGRSSLADGPRDSLGATSQGTVEGTADRPTSKSGKMKLALSFAQVAAMGSGSPSSLAPPLSSTTGSSFESPTFAHPSDSE